MMLVLLAAIGIASLLCNSGCWLWLAARWCRIPNVSYLRALAAVSLIAAINVMLRLPASELADRVGRPGAVWALYAIVSLVVAAACLKLILRARVGRSLAAGAIAFVISGAVALPVAFAFRSFVIESFAIPTGAMAPAILGRHFNVTCENCGLAFSVSAHERYQMRHALGWQSVPFANTRVRSQLAVCPNCETENALADTMPIVVGDHIFVDKLGRARRWDPLVYRYPGDRRVDYLHRLIGLPGETVEIIGGDIFINGRREAKAWGVANDLWVLVNDTRFRPTRLKPGDPQWQSAASSPNWRWDEQGWRFVGSELDSEELVFSGPISDESFYAEREPGNHPNSFDLPISVGDVRVVCTLRRFSGAGEIGFHWAFRGSAASATVSAAGEINLQAESGAKQARLPRPLAEAKTIAFAVRDGFMMLAVDEHEEANISLGAQDAETCRLLDVAAVDPCRIGIRAAHCELELSRIVVERDVYYSTLSAQGDSWCAGCKDRPMTLRPQEHYVLGDHSRRSNDSRAWDSLDPSLEGRYQQGTVPSGLIIGPAKCIYWQPARWHTLQ